MDNNVVEMDKITDETKQKIRDFDEQEAYFLLCEIFSNAQTSKNYAKFQTDLAEWQKRYPIELFSDDLKRKIKYMLSKEFLDSILKDFSVFDELSRKDPSLGLGKLRNILDSAEKHKNKISLEKDLNKLYEEYPLTFLKDKYPHVVPLLISQANIDKILEKFDSTLAFEELKKITDHPENFKSFEEYKVALEEYMQTFPIDDFNYTYKSQVQNLLNENLDEKNAVDLFPLSYIDLSDGEIVDLCSTPNLNLLERDARATFLKIVNNNMNDINGLYNWIYQYARYINSFDENTKNMVVSCLLQKYERELPTLSDYRLPTMINFDDNSSIEDGLNDINKMKKDTVIQLIGILSTGNTLSNNDYINLDLNNKQVKEIEIKSIDYELFNFMENKQEDELTFDKNTSLYLNPLSSSSIEGGTSITIANEYTSKTNEISELDLSHNDIDVTRNHSEVEDLKKGNALDRIWKFLHKDITNKKNNIEIDRDDER